jgi:GNAT superfamily N-acetyltransferase
VNVYPIRRAGAGDVDALLQLRAEAERWLRDQGVVQWTDDYQDYAREVLRTSAEAGKAWVVDDGAGQVVATVTLNGPDPDFWGWADDQDDGLYLGKMIVARSWRGRQVGDALLNWAGRRAAAASKTWVRLDCRRDNRRLQQYYLDRGFTHVRTYHAPGRRTESGWLAQRPAGVQTAAGTLLDEARLPA